jgi:hypothetical protein
MHERELLLHGAGQMAVQKGMGGGSFVCGLKRVLGPRDSLEASAALGERLL